MEVFYNSSGQYLVSYYKTQAVQDVTDKFMSSLNGIIAPFNGAFVDVKYKLFKDYCMPLHDCVLCKPVSTFISKYYITR